MEFEKLFSVDGFMLSGFKPLSNPFFFYQINDTESRSQVNAGSSNGLVLFDKKLITQFLPRYISPYGNTRPARVNHDVAIFEGQKKEELF